MLDDGLKAQLKGYLERLSQPVEILASLDESEGSQEMLRLLNDITTLSPQVTLEVRRDDGTVLSLISNDLCRPAATLAGVYRQRWQIELLFRWIKQHLKIGKFLGNNDNAIRLQLMAAMIAFALLRIAARAHRIALPLIRFADLVTQCLFERRQIMAIDKPPPVNPSTKKDRSSPNQMSFTYA